MMYRKCRICQRALTLRAFARYGVADPRSYECVECRDDPEPNKRWNIAGEIANHFVAVIKNAVKYGCH